MDKQFARRMEMAEELAGISVARAHRKMISESGAATLAVAGGTAIFVEPSSPITQCIGCGVECELSSRDIADIEEFYFSRAAGSQLVVSTEFAAALRAELERRDYTTIERNLAFYRELPFKEAITVPDGYAIHEVGEQDRREWAAMQAEIFAQFAESAAAIEPLFLLFSSSQGYRSYMAVHESTGELAAGAAIYVSPEKGIACIAGAATKPAHRGRGLQQSLLRRRLADATAARCDLAFMSTLLETTSCRNAQRQGFVRGYERVVMRKEAGGEGA